MTEEKRVKDKAVSDIQVMRTHKDTVFRMLFRDKRKLLSLFNAVNGTQYEDPEELQVNVLENAIYMNMKNDVPLQSICQTDDRTGLGTCGRTAEHQRRI